MAIDYSMFEVGVTPADHNTPDCDPPCSECRRWEVAQTVKAAAARALWFLRWPYACTACDGWGGCTSFYGSRTQPPEFDVCSRLEDDPDDDICCRCGVAHTMAVDLDKPCTNCGWFFNDGAPQL